MCNIILKQYMYYTISYRIISFSTQYFQINNNNLLTNIKRLLYDIIINLNNKIIDTNNGNFLMEY